MEVAARLDTARVRAAVGRLRDEFLVRERGGVVRGLHELRSATTLPLVHDLDLRDLADTLTAVIEVIGLPELVVAVRRSGSLADDAMILDALSRRVRRSGSARDLAAALHGLRLLDYDRSAAAAAERLTASVASGEEIGRAHV